MSAFSTALAKRPIVYITRDIERALGALSSRKNYFIVTNYTPFGKSLARGNNNIRLVKNRSILDTYELLEHPTTSRLLGQLSDPAIVVFKNTPQIERICRDHHWTLLNPTAELSAQVEEKVSQISWLHDLAAWLPPHQITTIKQVKWKNKPFILQFNRSHTGSGTLLIQSEAELTEWQKKFPDRPVRWTDYIPGPALTNNNVVWEEKILVGNINLQITGLPPFTERQFATVGNDWALPRAILNAQQQAHYHKLAEAIGQKLAAAGWRGLFGIDTVIDETNGQLYLIEINARQPASTTYESQLQSKNRKLAGKDLHRSRFLTTFEAHLCALLGMPYGGERLIPISDGAQIVQKVTPATRRITQRLAQIKKNLKRTRFRALIYSNNKPETDYVRIYSTTGIMKNYRELNERGEEILSIIQARPPALEQFDPGFKWESKKIWQLHLPPKEIDLRQLLWHLNLPFWEKENTDDWNLSPKALLKNPSLSPTHYQRIMESDLSYPIALYKHHGRWRILDGLHRLTRAYLAGHKKITAVIISKKMIPHIKR